MTTMPRPLTQACARCTAYLIRTQRSGTSTSTRTESTLCLWITPASKAARAVISIRASVSSRPSVTACCARRPWRQCGMCRVAVCHMVTTTPSSLQTTGTLQSCLYTCRYDPRCRPPPALLLAAAAQPHGDGPCRLLWGNSYATTAAFPVCLIIVCACWPLVEYPLATPVLSCMCLVHCGRFSCLSCVIQLHAHATSLPNDVWHLSDSQLRLPQH